MEYCIRAATEEDIGALQEIEVAAGEIFRGIGMDAIANDAPPATGVLTRAILAGTVWCAVPEEDEGTPVAYLWAERLEDGVHIEQVSVHPDHARRGLGAWLIGSCTHWAVLNGYSALTLTTFRDVPWNAPYYRRLGFVELSSDQMPAELREIVRREEDAGLHRWPRVAMRRQWTAIRGDHES